MATNLVGRTDSGTLATTERTRLVDALTRAQRAPRPVVSNGVRPFSSLPSQARPVTSRDLTQVETAV